jgi:hypothetical protein
MANGFVAGAAAGAFVAGVWAGAGAGAVCPFVETDAAREKQAIAR